MATDDVPYCLPLSFGYDGDDRLSVVFRSYSAAGRLVGQETSERYIGED